MRILGYFAVILAVLTVSLFFFLYGSYESKMAAAYEKFSVLDLGGADAIYLELEGYFSRAKWVPGVLKGFKKELRNKRMNIRYWREDYSGLISEIEILESGGIKDWELKFILGNSLYRNVAGEKNRSKAADALGAAVSSYALAIAGNPNHFDSAFNYEYLSRVKREVESRKRRLPLEKGRQGPGNEGIFGKEGIQQKGAVTDKIKIFVPLEKDEKKGEKTDKEGDGVGKGKVKKGPG